MVSSNGKKFRPKIQARFREGHGSHVIDMRLICRETEDLLTAWSSSIAALIVDEARAKSCYTLDELRQKVH